MYIFFTSFADGAAPCGHLPSGNSCPELGLCRSRSGSCSCRTLIFFMGNCCSCGATVPSPPQETEMRTMPVLSRPSIAKPPVPTKVPTLPPPFRTRSRLSPNPKSNPELTHHGGMSSRDLNPESRMEFLPQPPPSSPQNPSTGTQSATMSHPSPISLTSTVMQVLADQPKYVV